MTRDEYIERTARHLAESFVRSLQSHRVRVKAWRRPNEDGTDRPYGYSIPLAAWRKLNDGART